MRKGWTEEDLEKLIRIVKESEKKLPSKSKLLAELIFPFRIPSSKFRKRVTQFIKDSYKTSNFEKVAIYGGGITRKTIANFVIAASGIKSIKYFKTEEKALRWLKED